MRRLNLLERVVRGGISFFLFLINWAALGLSCGTWDLWSSLHHAGCFSCSMWDLALWLGVEPRLPALRAQSLSPWTTREVPEEAFLIRCCLSSDLKAVEKECHSHGGRAPRQRCRESQVFTEHRRPLLGAQWPWTGWPISWDAGIQAKGPSDTAVPFCFFHSLLKNAQKHQLPYSPLEKVKWFF